MLEKGLIPGILFLYPDRVRIVTRNGTEVEHPRRPVVGNTSYRNEDRVAKLAAVHGQRARLYQKRQEIPGVVRRQTVQHNQPHK